MAWDDSALTRGLKGSQDKMRRFASSARGALGAVGVGLGGAAAFAAIGRLSEKYDAIGKASRAAGIEVKAFQLQNHAFKLADIDMDSYVKMVLRMTRATEDAIGGNKTMVAGFKSLNIDLHAFKQLTPDKKVLAIADAYKNATDKEKAFSDLFKIIGRDANKFRDVFSTGAEGINAAGSALKNLVDRETIDKV